MRTVFLFFTGLLLLPFSNHSQAAIEISNLSDMAREEEVVAVSWKDVFSLYPTIDTANFVIIDAKTKKQAPYQLEYRGMAQVQNLLIQVTMSAKSNLRLQLQSGKRASFAAKTYCRYVPERKDDFAWENDKIAFRMYGKALEGTTENAYGTDVWAKRTDKLIINDWYSKGDYHADHGQGLDYYKVGFTLGAGDAAPYLNDSIWYSKNYRNWKVLDNGPLRCSFQLEYDEWDLPAGRQAVASQKVRVTKLISLDAGSQLNRIELSYSFNQAQTLPVVVGIVKRKEPGAAWLDESNAVMGYWEPVHGNDGITGVACLFMQPVQQMMMNDKHLLTVLAAKPGEPLVYYSGAAWDKAGVITSSQKWFDYIKMYKQKSGQPLKVVVRKGS